ncbi:hypothetical protein PaelaDRAFT_5521 [Paenibacillus lactis 154]|uniref:Uncharacterized protein n=1 Tax=Paenibacillus lactis 154 TaxID=743719 RepID=G4HNG0_9BACL|nr:hypothetical protein PaelaDRAFT_5521 [Paenibacillus lactis 154]
MKDELNKNLGSVYAPQRIKRLANKINKLFPEIQDKHQVALEVGCSLEDVNLAEVYLYSKNAVSLDRKLSEGRKSDKEISLIDNIRDSRDQYSDIIIFDFVQTLDINERYFFNQLFEGSSTSEIIKEVQFESSDTEQLLAGIQTKLLKYLNLDNKMQEELKMSIRKSNAKPITQLEFNELVKQGVSIKDIARRYRMSPATLRKRRSEWDASVQESSKHRVEHINQQQREVVSVEEYQKLLNDYQNLKMEHGFLWQYLKQLLSRMETPFSLNQK